MSNDRKLALTEVGTNEVEIMRFYLDFQQEEGVYRGHFGVNVAKVLKIIRMPVQVMRPPQCSHPSVIGAFLFQDRNRVIPLVGLAAYLDEKRAESNTQKVIITEFNEVITAFLVSGVTRIYRLRWSDVEQPDDLVNRYSKNAFTGLVKLDDEVVFILYLEKIVFELDPRAGQAFYSLAIDNIETDRKVRILHVDDQALVRKMVKRALEQNSDFEVHSASSGKEALDRIQAWKKQAEDENLSLHELIDVVITDIEMPVMDGYTLCKKIKDDDKLTGLPVYLFSSLINDEVRHKGLSVKADGQFPKPQTESMAKDIITALAKRFLADSATGR